MIGYQILGDAGRFSHILAEHQPRAVTVVDPDSGTGAEIKSTSPGTFILGRVYVPDHVVSGWIDDDPAHAALLCAQAVDEFLTNNRAIDAWIVQNEVNQTSVAALQKTNAFSIEFVNQMKARGARAGICAFSVGNPRTPQEDPAFWSAVYPAMRHARARGGVLVLHAYGAPNIYDSDASWYLHRYEERVMPHLPSDLREMPYLYGEYGCDMGVVTMGDRRGWKTGYENDHVAYAADLQRADGYLSQYPHCLGACVFTLGVVNADWTDFNIEGACAEHMAGLTWGQGEPPPAPPPPDPPGTGDDTMPDFSDNWALSGARYVPASVAAGTNYWRLTRAVFEEEGQSGGNHNIYIQEPHDPTKAFMVSNGQQTWRTPLDKPLNEAAGNFPMWAGNVYSAWMEGAPSDRVEGMQMIGSHHVNFRLWFEWTTAEGEEPPDMTLQEWLAVTGQGVATVPVTPGFKLYDAILRDGLIPNGPEVWEAYAGTTYALRSAEDATRKRSYYVAVPAAGQPWPDAAWIDRLNPTQPTQPVKPVTPKTVRLNVPWRSQLGANAKYGLGDCGPACLAMLLAWKGQNVTVDRVSLAMGLGQGYKSTSITALAEGARKFGLRLDWDKSERRSVQELVAQVDAGKPCIVLLDYTKLPYRYDANYRNGHYVVVVGYLDGGKKLLYHDPYWPGAGDGAYCWMDVEAPDGDLLTAWSSKQFQRTPRQFLKLAV